MNKTWIEGRKRDEYFIMEDNSSIDKDWSLGPDFCGSLVLTTLCACLQRWQDHGVVRYYSMSTCKPFLRLRQIILSFWIAEIFFIASVKSLCGKISMIQLATVDNNNPARRHVNPGLFL